MSSFFLGAAVAIFAAVVGRFLYAYFVQRDPDVRMNTQRAIYGVARWARSNDLVRALQRAPKAHGSGNLAWCVLGSPDSEKGIGGLEYTSAEVTDGCIELAAIGIGNSGRITKRHENQHYFYFRFSPDVVDSFRNSRVFLIVQFYDPPRVEAQVGLENAIPEAVAIHYDASIGESMRDRFRRAAPVPLNGRGEWRYALFTIENAGFSGRTNGADFRVCLDRASEHRPLELAIREVIAVRA